MDYVKSIPRSIAIACLSSISASGQVCDGNQLDTFALTNPPFSTDFGHVAAMDSNHVFVGMPGDDHGGTGAGSVRVYKDDGTGWSPSQTIRGSDISGNDSFGYSLAVEGNVLAIGAIQQEGDHGFATGAVYVFELSGNQWVEQAKLFPAADAGYNNFGYTLSIDNGTIAVGSINDATVTKFDGAVYFFDNNDGKWLLTDVLRPTDSKTGSGANFGRGLAASGSIVAAGAIGRYSYQDRIPYINIFRRDGSAWVEDVVLTEPDMQQFSGYGTAIAIDGDTLVTGASYYEVDGQLVGAAFIYDYDGTEWNLTQQLNAPNGVDMDQYGLDVSIENDIIIISAVGASQNGIKSGKAYIYHKSSNGWVEAGEIAPETQIEDGQFGHDVYMHNGLALIAATSSANVSFPNESGIVYMYDVQCDKHCDNPADVNDDGIISPVDFTAWINAFNNSLPECDQNGDTVCSPTDFTSWIANYNIGC